VGVGGIAIVNTAVLRRRELCSYGQFFVKDLGANGVHLLQAHLAQGFARKPDFVMFTTILEWPWATIDVHVGTPEPGQLAGATRVIQCPLLVASGKLAVQVVAEDDYDTDGVVGVQPGPHRITMCQRRAAHAPTEIEVGIWVTQTRTLEPGSRILVTDEKLSVVGALLETAEEMRL